MIVNSLGTNSALSVQTLIDMRNQLDDLQRQLGTGKKADSYAGLGLDRGLTVGLRSHLSAMSGYQQTITEVGVRLDLAADGAVADRQHRPQRQVHGDAVALRAGQRQPDARSAARRSSSSTRC